MSEVGLLLEHIRACADIWNDTGVSRVRAITTATREIEAKLAAAEPEEPVDMSGEWVADDGTRVTVHPPDEGAAAIAAMDKVMGALPSAADVKGILKGHAPPPASDGYWEGQQSAWRQAAAMALDEHKQAAARIAALTEENRQESVVWAKAHADAMSQTVKAEVERDAAKATVAAYKGDRDAAEARVLTVEAWWKAAAEERDAMAARVATLVKENVLAWNTCGEAETARDALAARVATLEEALKFARQAIDKNSRDGRIAMRALATIDAALGEPK